MADLIPAPVLEVRDEELLAAQMIARVSGGITPERVDRNIAVQRELHAMLLGGNLPAPPVCPELTNANPSSPHTVILEAMAWLVAFVSRRLNRVPEQNKIEFARLFGVELRGAAPATTTLRFTVNPPGPQEVVVPAGTEVRTADGAVAFRTDAGLALPAGVAAGEVAATRTEPGRTVLAPGTLTQAADAVAWLESVTNPAAVESGADAETVEAALERARNYQRRGERLVSARDVRDAIFEEVLQGSGVVRVWPFVKDGDYSQPFAGHNTVVMMTPSGQPVSAEVKAAARRLLGQHVGSQFFYLKDPQFAPFAVSANVRVSGLAAQGAAVAAAERALRAFYAVKEDNFGRAVLRSEIIAIIEGTPGVDRIMPQPGGAILASPAADVDIQPFELPLLGEVTLNVVP